LAPLPGNLHETPPKKLASQFVSENSQIGFRPSQISWGQSLLPVLILLVSIIAFLPVLLNGFVDWDDKPLVNNPNYRGLGLSQLQWMFTDFHTGQYQPLSWITLGADHFLWWMDPFGYHLTSLLLHAASAIVFYFMTMRLLTLEQFGLAKPREPALSVAAGFAALVFAVHPLRVEPVAWASARADIVAGLFFLCTILCYLQVAGLSESDHKRLWWMSASVIIYALSLLSNAAGVALPIVLLLLDIYPLKRLGSGAGKWFGPQARRVWWQKVPFFLLALGALVLTLATERQTHAADSLSSHGIATQAAYIVFAPAFYLWKTVVPHGFSPLYDLPVWSLALGGVMVAVISVGLFFVRRQWPAVLATWVCYVVILLPVLVTAQASPQMIADRYSYLACLPLAVLTGGGLLHSWQLWVGGQVMRWTSVPAGGVAALLLLGLGSLTWKQTQVWHDSEKLWRHTVVVSRSSGAHYNLAVLLEARGKTEEATEHYEQAAQIDPLRWDAHHKAALLLQKQGRSQEAIEHYRNAVQINPNLIEAQNNLAAALAIQGELEEAAEHLRKVLEFYPGLSETHFKLATILALQGHLEEAADHLRQALKIKPNDVESFLNLGRVLAAQGKLDQAIDYFRQALRIQPDNAEVHESLGRALAEQGKKGEASKHLQEALRILKSSPASR
jgi:protein O-mannosyl-transferase